MRIPIRRMNMSRKGQEIPKIERIFLAAYDRYADALFRHCYYRVFDREKAKDLVQETFMKTWKELVSGTEIRDLKPFLYRVATNAIIDYRRKKKEESLDVLTEQGREPSSDPRSSLEEKIDVQTLLAFLQQIPEEDRELLLLRYVEGFKPKEIAELMQESPNVISVRLHRAKSRWQSLSKDWRNDV